MFTNVSNIRLISSKIKNVTQYTISSIQLSNNKSKFQICSFSSEHKNENEKSNDSTHPPRPKSFFTVLQDTFNSLFSNSGANIETSKKDREFSPRLKSKQLKRIQESIAAREASDTNYTNYQNARLICIYS